MPKPVPDPSHTLYGRGQTISDAEIVRLYAECKDAATVAQRAGVSSTTVLVRVRAAGGEVHPPGHRRGRPRPALLLPDAEICRRYLGGQSGPAVAAQAGCRPRLVYAILEAAGIRRRPPADTLNPPRAGKGRARDGPSRIPQDHGPCRGSGPGPAQGRPADAGDRGAAPGDVG